MIYLDYSATTPVKREVLDSFNKASLLYIGNANSLHKLGQNINKLINACNEQIASLLNIKPSEIIYTSSSSESNNLAIKGIAFKYQNRGKHIITTKFEHSSVMETVKYLEKLGYEISYVKTTSEGIVDLEDLKKIIRKDTILVAITAVNSEIGILNPIEEIANLLKNYQCFFCVDLTQSITKVNINLENVDLAIFSAHKFYGLKGISVLIKKEKIELEPLINGGKSTTIYRSGTPAHPLIVSIAKALRLEMIDIEKKYQYVKELNEYLKENLKKYSDVIINSNDYSIPHILNISVLGVKAETMMHALEEDDIYISTKTACSDDDSYSFSVYELTKDMERSKSSIRISLSYLTTKEELDKFLKSFEKCYQNLKKLI